MSDLYPDDPCSCNAGIEGVREDCCLHDLPSKHKFGRGQICCWCGDLFAQRQDSRASHGEYEPGISPSVEKKRAATGRKEARLKRNEEIQHLKDYYGDDWSEHMNND